MARSIGQLNRRQPARHKRRALLIVNQKSRSASTDLSAGVALLKARGVQVLENYPERADGIPALIRKHKNEVDLVILGGGDGTMNAGASALLETGLPLGILPLGTANDLARTFGIPREITAACAIILERRLHRVDLGCVNGVHFFNVANIGLGVRVAHSLSSELKRRWGVFAYFRAVMRAIREHKPFTATIRCGGRQERLRTIQIAIGNGRHYGGGMTIAAQAAIDDGLLHLYSVKPVPWWRLPAIAVALRRGEEREAVERFAGKQIEIETRKPMTVCADGEMATRTPARFQVIEKALQVCVPAAYAGLTRDYAVAR
ncbi:MAG TPA: lipid kinase [Burkholderiales bacterium]|nr:lipid kinase [Burkholderiales bacterium]